VDSANLSRGIRGSPADNVTARMTRALSEHVRPDFCDRSRYVSASRVCELDVHLDAGHKASNFQSLIASALARSSHIKRNRPRRVNVSEIASDFLHGLSSDRRISRRG